MANCKALGPPPEAPITATLLIPKFVSKAA
jgi:hypothetical protein